MWLGARSVPPTRPALTPFLLVPVLSQKSHHAEFLVPLVKELQALLTLPIIDVLGELTEVSPAELGARLKIGRDQSQDFRGQSAAELLAWHLESDSTAPEPCQRARQ
jgi:hypothetical protein